MTFDPYEIILKPYVTEKTLLMLERENKLTFIVRRSATKREIKAAVERLFEVEVDQVNTIISKYGKKAIVKLKEGYSAEEVGMRLGIF